MIYDPKKVYGPHPVSAHKLELLVLLRDRYIELAQYIKETCPGSREQALAWTNLEQSYWWATQAIERPEAGAYWPKQVSDKEHNADSTFHTQLDNQWGQSKL